MPVFVVLRSLISTDLHDAVVGSEADHALRMIECPFVALNRQPDLIGSTDGFEFSRSYVASLMHLHN